MLIRQLLNDPGWNTRVEDLPQRRHTSTVNQIPRREFQLVNAFQDGTRSLALLLYFLVADISTVTHTLLLCLLVVGTGTSTPNLTSLPCLRVACIGNGTPSLALLLVIHEPLPLLPLDAPPPPKSPCTKPDTLKVSPTKYPCSYACLVGGVGGAPICVTIVRSETARSETRMRLAP